MQCIKTWTTWPCMVQILLSKVDQSNRFWKDTFKGYELFKYTVKQETTEETLAGPLVLNENIKTERKCILFNLVYIKEFIVKAMR